VIHADPDDYKTDPSGNSGARIACAVLGTPAAGAAAMAGNAMEAASNASGAENEAVANR
jgi:hypothetical protein